MILAVVRNVSSPQGAQTQQELGDFEQEVVDQYDLVRASAGPADGHVGNTQSAIIDVACSLPGAIWTASCEGADLFLAGLRH